MLSPGCIYNENRTFARIYIRDEKNCGSTVVVVVVVIGES